VNDMANTYRLIVVLSAALGDEGIASLTDTIKAKVESGATLNSLDSLGVKELAYEIEGQKNGYYVQANFTAESDFPKELERVLKITDGVIRFIVVRVGE
jgi:small subunit ribosomal protein S6